MYSKLFLVSAAIMATVSANMKAQPKVNCDYMEKSFAMYHSPRSMECCKTGGMMGKKEHCQKNMVRARAIMAKRAKRAGCKMPSVNTAICKPENQKFIDMSLMGSCPRIVARRPKNPDGPGCNKAEWEKEQQREGPDAETKKVMMWCIKTQSCAEHVQKAYMKAHPKPKHLAKKAHHGKHAKEVRHRKHPEPKHHAKNSHHRRHTKRVHHRKHAKRVHHRKHPEPKHHAKNSHHGKHAKAAANGPKLPKKVLECLKKTNTHWPEKHCDMVTAQSALYNSRDTLRLCLEGKMGPRGSPVTCKKMMKHAKAMVKK